MYFSKKSVFSSLFDQGVTSSANLVLAALIIRASDYEVYGLFVLVLLVGALLLTAQGSIITSVMVVVFPKVIDKYREKYLFSLNWMFLAFVSVAFFVFCFMYPFVVIKTEKMTGFDYLLSVVYVFGLMVQDYFKRIFFLRNQSGYAVVSAVLFFGTQLLLVYFLFNNGGGYSDLINILAIPAGVAVFALLFFACKWSWSYVCFLYYVKKHWKDGSWLFYGALINWFSNNYYILISGVLLGSLAIGIVRAVQNIFGLITLACQAFENFMPRYLASIYAKYGYVSFCSTLKRFFFIQVIMVFVLVFALYISSDFLVGILYKNKNQTGVDIELYVGIATFFLGASLPIRYALRVLGYTKPFFMVYFFVAVQSFLLGGYLINGWGLAGAGFGLLLVQLQVFVILTLSLFYYLKLIKTGGVNVRVL